MIAIYGAAGNIGRRIAALLADGGYPIALVGRDRARLVAVADELSLLPGDVRVAPIHEPAALAAAFADATVVIGAAGPYHRVGAPVAAAALAAGAHYLDVAAEPGFVRALYEEHESAARRAGRCLVSGLGVVGALGDWAAHWAAATVAAGSGGGDRGSSGGGGGGSGGGGDRRDIAAAPGRIAEDDPLDAISIGYTFDGARFAAGMGRSLVAALTAPTVGWRSGRWDEIRPGGRTRRFEFGALGPRTAHELPTIEAITVPRHVAAHRVDTFVAPTGQPWVDRAIGAAAPLLRWLPVLAATVDALADPRRSPDDAAHAASRFAIAAEARRGDHAARVTIAGHDVYGTTAALCAQLARALANGALDGAGVLAPSQLLAGERAFGILTDLTITTSF